MGVVKHNPVNYLIFSSSRQRISTETILRGGEGGISFLRSLLLRAVALRGRTAYFDYRGF